MTGPFLNETKALRVRNEDTKANDDRVVSYLKLNSGGERRRGVIGEVVAVLSVALLLATAALLLT